MSDENQNGGGDGGGGGDGQDSQDQTFLGKHGCLITIIGVLLVGAALGLWGFVSWLERGG
tara:strand:- start:6562 stop:6741 length:180 start_codon:yes stop_codon:yes gene_type:complete